MNVFYLFLRTAIPLLPVRRHPTQHFLWLLLLCPSQGSLATMTAVINYVSVMLCVTLTLVLSLLLPQGHLKCSVLSSELIINLTHCMNICQESAWHLVLF